jgi:hypothetical protein
MIRTFLRYFLLLLVVLAVVAELAFVFHMNYVCGSDEYLIRYKVDAIARAQKRMFKAHYGTHDIPGYIDEKPYIADFSRPDCCHAERTVVFPGFILWTVTLDGETIGEPKKRHVGAYIKLSNCGMVLDDSYILATPIR